MDYIGLLGGGFDPVHNGHIAIAETVKKQMALNSVLFIPAAVPPLKETSASFSDRLHMLNLVLADREGFEITAMEAERQGPSYTVDTLHILQKRYGEDTELFFITGFDAFSEIKLWKSYNELLRLASFVVIDRPSHSLRSLEEFCARELFDVYPAGEDVWQVKGGRRIYRVKMEPIDISSTEIRERLRRNLDISGLVPEKVADYIYKNKLYIS
ncbi:MAG: nicotinate-nucleotide adenylyltransferase [Desulfurivibrionaceae bacterium]